MIWVRSYVHGYPLEKYSARTYKDNKKEICFYVRLVGPLYELSVWVQGVTEHAVPVFTGTLEECKTEAEKRLNNSDYFDYLLWKSKENV